MSVSLRRRVRRTLHDLYLSVFHARSDGKVDEKGEGTFRDAYFKSGRV